MGMNWEGVFLNEANVLLSMCEPCMPPPSFPVSYSIHFLPLHLPQQLQAHPPAPSHIPATPATQNVDGEEEIVPLVWVCPPQPLAPPGDQRWDWATMQNKWWWFTWLLNSNSFFPPKWKMWFWFYWYRFVNEDKHAFLCLHREPTFLALVAALYTISECATIFAIKLTFDSNLIPTFREAIKRNSWDGLKSEIKSHKRRPPHSSSPGSWTVQQPKADRILLTISVGGTVGVGVGY